ncbi:MAG: hypothetical protein LUI12_01890 [Clostridiales bacterium]|nr:hypothetical protein [Clostridiales bacterium]
MEFYENKDISIMCPNCKKFLAKADKRDGTIHKKVCGFCHKWIWFKPNDKGYREIRDIPVRMTSAGMTFY